MEFTSGPDHDLEQTTGNVITGLYPNKAFPSPPVDQATLQTGLTEFTASVASAAQGGPHATALRNKKRHALIAMLRQLALYVQASCNDDLQTLLSSGFLAASTSRTKQPLPKPVITSVDLGNSGQAIVKVKAIRNAKTYDVRYAPVGKDGALGPQQTQPGFTNSRSMIISGLTPLTTYTFQVRAGGTMGFTDYSDAVNHLIL
jgi:hypothetical protein